MAYKEIATQEDFKKQVIENNGLSIVDFWAPWCGPCKMFGPVFERVSDEVTDVNFVKVNVDEEEGGDIAGSYSVMSIPTIVLIKNGEVVDQKSGIMGDDDLKAWLEENK